MDLSDTQQAILSLIAERIEAEGMPPSQAEIARAFGFSGVRPAQYHLDALEAAGAIEPVPGRARGIRLLRVTEAAAHALPRHAGGHGHLLELPVTGDQRD